MRSVLPCSHGDLDLSVDIKILHMGRTSRYISIVFTLPNELLYVIRISMIYEWFGMKPARYMAISVARSRVIYHDALFYKSHLKEGIGTYLFQPIGKKVIIYFSTIITTNVMHVSNHITFTTTFL